MDNFLDTIFMLDNPVVDFIDYVLVQKWVIHAAAVAANIALL